MRAVALDDDLDRAISELPDTLLIPFDDMLTRHIPGANRDPISALLALRDEAGPVVRLDENGCHGGRPFPTPWVQLPGTPTYLVLGFEEVREVLNKADQYINGDGAHGAVAEAFGGNVLIFIDGDEHRKHRRLMTQALGRPAVEAMTDELVTPVVEFLVDRLGRRLAEGQPACFAKDLGLPLAFKVVTDLMGLPPHLFGSFIGVAMDAFYSPSDLAKAMGAVAQLAELWTSELQKRREEPRADLLTWMDEASLPDGSRFTDDEILAYARLFLPAGVETTARQIPMTGYTLLADPTRWQTIVDAPDLIPAAIEETMRHSCAVLNTGRRAVSDCTLGGVDIPAGAEVVIYTGIANLDPTVFERPMEFDVHRPSRAHLGFAAGPHHCIGVSLAKTEMRVLIECLVANIPDLRLACAPEDVEILGMGVRSCQGVPLARG
jgi:cytochrome P450